jgi:hypothetical protein
LTAHWLQAAFASSRQNALSRPQGSRPEGSKRHALLGMGHIRMVRGMEREREIARYKARHAGGQRKRDPRRLTSFPGILVQPPPERRETQMQSPRTRGLGAKSQRLQEVGYVATIPQAWSTARHPRGQT